MDSLSPNTLWRRFTTDIATPAPDLAPHPGDSFEEVMNRIRDLAVRLPPHALQVIDPVLYERGMRGLTEQELLDFATEVNDESDTEMSLTHAREMASEQFAVLDPIHLLSFPYPEIRAILIGRFGPNSVTARLHDLYEFESSDAVKGVIVEAMHARIHWKEIKPRERLQIFSVAKEILQRGYDCGSSIVAARSAFYLLAELRPQELPEALQRALVDLDVRVLQELSVPDRIGVVRILGPRLQSESLLELVAHERHLLALEVLLEECHERWGAGFFPLDNQNSLENQRDVWRSIAAVMIRRLGFSGMPLESLRVVLQADLKPDEPRWRSLLRTIALIALDEGMEPGLP